MRSGRTTLRRASTGASLALVGVVSVLLITGCSADDSGTESSEDVSTSTSVVSDAGAGDCAGTVSFFEPDLYGKAWLVGHKQNAPAPGVTLRRCHYVNIQNTEPPPPPAAGNDTTGKFVPPPVMITDSDEVQRILLALPDSPEQSFMRCPSAYLYSFDEYTALDQAGRSVAKFRTSEGAGSCGISNVIPTT